MIIVNSKSVNEETCFNYWNWVLFFFIHCRHFSDMPPPTTQPPLPPLSPAPRPPSSGGGRGNVAASGGGQPPSVGNAAAIDAEDRETYIVLSPSPGGDTGPSWPYTPAPNSNLWPPNFILGSGGGFGGVTSPQNWSKLTLLALLAWRVRR